MNSPETICMFSVCCARDPLSVRQSFVLFIFSGIVGVVKTIRERLDVHVQEHFGHYSSRTPIIDVAVTSSLPWKCFLRRIYVDKARSRQR